MTKPEELFARHHRDVLRYLWHMTGRFDEAEDLTQEVFVKVVCAIKNGGSIGHERGWVFSIARNLLADQRREQRRRVEAEAVREPVMRESHGLAFDLRQSLQELPAADCEILLLKEVGGLSYQEISEACQCSVEAVRARLHRARVALRTIMSPAAAGRDNES